MFCNYCKSARPENEAPCPYCGSPSSLLGQTQAGSWGTAGPVSTTWGGPATPSNEPWNDQGSRFSFGSPAMSQQQVWGSYSMTQVQEQPGVQQSARQSLLPIPYQENAQTGYQGYPQNQMQLVPMQNGSQMLPAIPDEMGAQESIYVPPMYTKPRPIIPAYRIISGFLSVLIMAVLLCGGSVYYAKATGKFTGLQRLIGTKPPAPVSAAPAPQIPDPPNKVDTGPAVNIITAAATTAHVDPNNLTPRQSDQIFQVNVPFYVTYSARPPKPGHIIIKWYMNNQHYIDTISDKTIDPKTQPSISGDAKMVYSVPAEGKVELYWSDQAGTETLAQTLYFAVR